LIKKKSDEFDDEGEEEEPTELEDVDFEALDRLFD